MNAASAGAARKSQEPSRSVFAHVPSSLRFFGVAAVLLALDLSSKAWVFQSLSPTERLPLFANAFEIRRSLNAGAVFGTFAGQVNLFILASVFALGFVIYLFARSSRRQRGLHVALACILAGALGNLYDRALVTADVVVSRTETGREEMFIGKIMSAPGEPVLRVGDFPDGGNPRSFRASEVHVRRQGVVRDFIKFVPRFPGWVPRLGGVDIWPWVFNIADSSLVCGVGVMLLTCCSRRKPRAKA